MVPHPYRRILLFLTVASVLTVASIRADGPSTIPDTPAGRCVKAFVDAFNSGSEEKVIAFERTFRAQSALQKRPMDERVKQAAQLRSDMGRLETRQIVSATESAITVLMHASQPNAHFEFQFVFESTAPHGLDYVMIQGPIAVEATSEPAKPLTEELITSSLQGIAEAVDANYVFPDKGKKMADMLREKAAQGAYKDCKSRSDLARRVTDDLRAVCNDKHLGVRAGAMQDFHGGGPMRRAGSREDARRDNYGFQQVEHLPGNIGYVRFDEFNPSPDAIEVAAGAMAFLSGSEALIFDMRYNGGGSPEMIRFLSSYLFDKPTHLNSFYDRSSNKTEEFWTLETVPGKRFAPDIPVYVLTSNRTFSGAEEFSYNLQNLKRATLIGETTGGGAHPVRPVQVNDQFYVMVPFARAENPISKTNWEGVGVKPHIEIDASQALDKAKELAAQQIEKRRAG
jgi:hypothetical protein